MWGVLICKTSGEGGLRWVGGWVRAWVVAGRLDFLIDFQSFYLLSQLKFHIAATFDALLLRMWIQCRLEI